MHVKWRSKGHGNFVKIPQLRTLHKYDVFILKRFFFNKVKKKSWGHILKVKELHPKSSHTKCEVSIFHSLRVKVRSAFFMMGIKIKMSSQGQKVKVTLREHFHMPS